MKIKELKNLSKEELLAKEKQIKKDLYDLSNQRQLGKLEKPANVRNFRRDIARILTVLNGIKGKKA